MAISREEIEALKIDDFLQKKPLDLDQIREMRQKRPSGNEMLPQERVVMDQAMQQHKQAQAALLAQARPQAAAAAPPPSAMTTPSPGGGIRRMEYNSHSIEPSWGRGGILPDIGPALAKGARGVGNWLAGIGEAIEYGGQGLSVPQAHYIQEHTRALKSQAIQQQADNQMKQLEFQKAMKLKQATDNIQPFQAKMPLFKKHLQPFVAEMEKEFKALGKPPIYDMSLIQKAIPSWNAARPDLAMSPVDQDTMTFTQQGAAAFMDMGIYPPEEQSKLLVGLRQQELETFQKQQQNIQLSAVMQQRQLQASAQPGPLPPNVTMAESARRHLAGQEVRPEMRDLVQRSGMNPLNLERMVNSGQLDPSLQRNLEQAMTTAMKETPGTIAEQEKLVLQEGMKSRLEDQSSANKEAREEERDIRKAKLEEQKAADRDIAATKKSQEVIRQIDRRGEIQATTATIKGVTQRSLKELEYDLKNDNDRAKGVERMAELKFKIENRPEGSMGLQDKIILSMVNGAMAGGRVDAVNLSKNLRQMAAITHDDEKTILASFIKSGAVSPGDLWAAAEKADDAMKLNPEKAGSQTKMIFDALQEVQEERALDPFTDAVNYALSAEGNPNKISELIKLENQWETRMDQAKTPEEKAKWEKGIRKAEASLQRVEVAKTGGKIRGNALFQSASQPVKDWLLAQKGDLMENATASDVEKGMEFVQDKAIEKNIAMVEGGKQKRDLAAAGKILATLTTLQQLGQSLFADTISGRFGSASRAATQAVIKTDDRYVMYEKMRKGLLSLFSKGISQNVGTLSDQDMEKAENLTSTPGFGWFSLPDTKSQFNGNIDTLKDLVRIGFDKGNLGVLANIERDFAQADQRDPALQSVLSKAKAAAAAAAEK